jgi:hypothetical protein
VKINWAFFGFVSFELNKVIILHVRSGCILESNSSIIRRFPLSKASIMGYAKEKYFIVPSDSFFLNGKVTALTSLPSSSYCVCVLTIVLSIFSIFSIPKSA